MKTLLLLLLLTLPALGQVETKYDKFRDQTTYGVAGQWSKLSYFWDIVVSRDGSSEYLLSLIPVRDRDCYGYCFNSPTLIFLIDGKRYQFTEDHLGDTVIINVQRDLLESIATAKSVEFQISHYTGKLTAKDIAKVRALLSSKP